MDRSRVGPALGASELRFRRLVSATAVASVAGFPRLLAQLRLAGSRDRRGGREGRKGPAAICVSRAEDLAFWPGETLYLQYDEDC